MPRLTDHFLSGCTQLGDPLLSGMDPSWARGSGVVVGWMFSFASKFKCAANPNHHGLASVQQPGFCLSIPFFLHLFLAAGSFQAFALSFAANERQESRSNAAHADHFQASLISKLMKSQNIQLNWGPRISVARTKYPADHRVSVFLSNQLFCKDDLAPRLRPGRAFAVTVWAGAWWQGGRWRGGSRIGGVNDVHLVSLMNLPSWTHSCGN